MRFNLQYHQMALSIFFIFYLLSLITFRVMFNPLICCVFLLLKSILITVMSYFIFSLSWLSLLFCIVYVGGVYIVLLFVSAHLQKDQFGRVSMFLFFCYFLSILIIGFVTFDSGDFCSVFRYNLVASDDIYPYVVFCIIVLLIFVVIRLISRVKSRFLR